MSHEYPPGYAIEFTTPMQTEELPLAAEIPTFIPAEGTKKKLGAALGILVTLLTALLCILYGTVNEALGVLFGLVFLWTIVLAVVFFFRHRRKLRRRRKKKQFDESQQLKDHELENIYQFLEQMKKTGQGREMLDEFVEEYMEDELGFELSSSHREEDFPIKSISFTVSE